MKNAFLLFIFAFLLLNVKLSSAQNVGIGTNTPKAALDVTSTNNGFLPPRMTFTQRNAIINPEQGLMIYCTDCDSSGQPQFYNGTKWCNMLGGAASGIIPANLPSVTIGTQKWSAKNLDVATYKNGDPIPQVTNPIQWQNLTTGAWCWYNNDSATYAATYGRLYNWYAVIDPRGLAPTGWHVPSNSEWDKVTKYLDPSVDTTCNGGCWSGTTIGLQLKNTSGWSGSGNGTNSSGFAALPGGSRNVDGTFGIVGFNGVWWSGSEYDATVAWDREMYFDSNNVYRFFNFKTRGFSVRVVRD